MEIVGTSVPEAEPRMTIEDFREKCESQVPTKPGRCLWITSSYPGRGVPAASEAQTGIGRNESNYRSKRKKESYTASWMTSIRAVTLWRIRYVNVAFHRAFRAVPER